MTLSVFDILAALPIATFPGPGLTELLSCQRRFQGSEVTCDTLERAVKA